MELVDASGSTIRSTDVPDALATEGIVFLRHGEVPALADYLSMWTRPYTHPHEESPGFTRIRAAHHRRSDLLPGFAGFSNNPLKLHTDRATSRNPPPLMTLLVIEAPASGGEALLVDIGPTVDQLAQLPTFSDLCHGTVLSSADGEWPILEEMSSDTYRFRYRDDEIANPRLTNLSGLPLLREIRRISEYPKVIELGAGEGYMVHNHRFLHGRRSFRGRREVARFLATMDIPFTLSSLPQNNG